MPPFVFPVEGEEQSPEVRVTRSVCGIQFDRMAKGYQSIVVPLEAEGDPSQVVLRRPMVRVDADCFTKPVEGLWQVALLYVNVPNVAVGPRELWVGDDRVLIRFNCKCRAPISVFQVVPDDVQGLRSLHHVAWREPIAQERPRRFPRPRIGCVDDVHENTAL